MYCKPSEQRGNGEDDDDGDEEEDNNEEAPSVEEETLEKPAGKGKERGTRA